MKMRAQLARALRAAVFGDADRDCARENNRSRCSRVATAAESIARALLEQLEPRQLLSTYYVSTTGSDSAAGTAMTAAWKTVGRVNSQKLKAGDTVLFAGGQTFSGGISVPNTEGGSSSAPVTFSTWGSGRATIKSGAVTGLEIANTGNIAVNNLNFTGAGMTSNLTPGIFVHVEWNARSFSNLNISNCDVSGYGQEAMRLKVTGVGSSFNNVKVINASLHDNLWGGIKVTGSAQASNKNYTIDHVKAYNSPGSKAAGGVTGSGIYLADVDGAIITRSIAHDNGKDGAAPVGIWAAGSNRVTIQYCESYNNHTATTTDGGGFDFDWDVTNSTVQYSYSHNNDGPGYILAAGDHVNAGNTVRYNVSENDGRRNGRAGMQLWGNVTNASIYNNVVYLTATGNSNSSAFYAHDNGSNGKRPQNVSVVNNIFYTTGGAKLVNVTSGVASYGKMIFNGNDYFSGTGTFKIQWGTTNYAALKDWQTSKGFEKLNGTATGYQGDPKLMSAGLGGTIGNADNLKALGAYKLQSGSPLVNKGVAPPTFLAATGTDFYGDVLPKGGKYDVGIDELA